MTLESLATAVRLTTYGDYAIALPKLNLPQRQISIRVRLDPSLREDLATMGQLRVAGAKGTGSLASVADTSMGSGPSQIDRMDRSRKVTRKVELNGRTLGKVEREVKALPALQLLPAGVHFVDQGELQRMSELFTSFGTAMGAGMMPNALGMGAEPSFRQPMAIVVIGGLLTSTALSLLVVPVLFTYVDDLLLFGGARSSV